MATHGFVYILANEYMPNLYKIGCTERAPNARACEVSRGTGIPSNFQVLCYAEFEDFQGVERQIHRWLEPRRVNPSREFFSDCLVYAVKLLWWHPRRISFCDATQNATNPLLSELLARIGSFFSAEFNYFNELENPFQRGVKVAEDVGFEAFLAKSLAAPLAIEQSEQHNGEAA